MSKAKTYSEDLLPLAQLNSLHTLTQKSRHISKSACSVKIHNFTGTSALRAARMIQP